MEFLCNIFFNMIIVIQQKSFYYLDLGHIFSLSLNSVRSMKRMYKRKEYLSKLYILRQRDEFLVVNKGMGYEGQLQLWCITIRRYNKAFVILYILILF